MRLMSLRILIIEDNEQNRYLLTFLLEKHGHTVQAAIDGPSGMRRDVSTGHIPIVAVTSYAMPGDRERAIGSGCKGYVEKPIDPATFVAQVEAYCGLAAPGGQCGSGSGC